MADPSRVKCYTESGRGELDWGPARTLGDRRSPAARGQRRRQLAGSRDTRNRLATSWSTDPASTISAAVATPGDQPDNSAIEDRYIRLAEVRLTAFTRRDRLGVPRSRYAEVTALG